MDGLFDKFLNIIFAFYKNYIICHDLEENVFLLLSFKYFRHQEMVALLYKLLVLER